MFVILILEMGKSQFKSRNKNIEFKLDKLTKLHEVFKDNRWPINKKNNNSRFEKYIKLLEFLNCEEEQDLILELTKRFKHIHSDYYLQGIANAVEKLLKANDEIKMFYVLPTLTKSDFNNSVKSSHTVAYAFKGDELEEYVEFGNAKFRVVSSIDKLNKKNNFNFKTEKILFVDDFIGSGDTALEAIDILDEKLRSSKNILFLSIVIHDIGKQNIESEKYKTYYDELIKRGISDYYEGDVLENKKNVMRRIESKFKKIKKGFNFGYKGCESLISMKRIPNNTFPVYWVSEKYSPYKR